VSLVRSIEEVLERKSSGSRSRKQRLIINIPTYEMVIVVAPCISTELHTSDHVEVRPP
jgi:hypothetical protein